MSQKKSVSLILTLMITLSTTLALSLPICLSTLAQSQTTQKAEADRLLRQGTQLFIDKQFQATIPVFEKALKLYQEIGDREKVDLIIGTLVTVSDVVNDSARALKYRQQQLANARLTGDRTQEATLLAELAVFFDNYVQRIEYIEQSITIAREIKNSRLVVAGLNALGSIYFELGNFNKANDYTQKAYNLSKTENFQIEKIKNLSQLGRIHLYGLAQFDQAIDYFKQSLSLAKTDSKYRFFQAGALVGLGSTYMSQGEYKKAIDYFEQVGAINRSLQTSSPTSLNLAIEAERFGLLAEAYSGAKDYPKAISYARQHIASLEGNPYSNRESQASALTNLGYVLYAAGDLKGAEDALRQGIHKLNAIRSSLNVEDSHRVSYADTFISVFYEILQQVFLAQNQSGKALEITEEARARTFVELLATRRNMTQAGKTNFSIALASPDLKQIQQIAKTQNATLVIYSFIYDSKQARLPARLKGHQADQQSDLLIWVIQPDGNYNFRQVNLKQKTLALRSIVETSRIAIGAKGRSDVEVKTSPEMLNQLSTQRTQSLQQLHQLLIEPIADLLPKDPNQRVIFMPQGELFLVPFPALLNAQNQPLITQHTILTAPSIQTLDLTHTVAQALPKGNRPALVVGNPTMPAISTVIGDSPSKLKALPGAEKEAIAIAQQLNTQPIIGAKAKKDTIVKQMQSAGVIHLATHGLLDSFKGDTPGAIALAPNGTGERNDGLLTSGELFDLKLSAELVVLSACDTGRGDITGDGVIGLSRSLFVAGVPSVIVSLWKVPDDSTAFLMTEFYRNWKDRKLDKAQALRQAMLTTREKYPQPLDWAAFTLIGEAE